MPASLPACQPVWHLISIKEASDLINVYTVERRASSSCPPRPPSSACILNNQGWETRQEWKNDGPSKVREGRRIIIQRRERKVAAPSISQSVGRGRERERHCSRTKRAPSLRSARVDFSPGFHSLLPSPLPFTDNVDHATEPFPLPAQQRMRGLQQRSPDGRRKGRACGQSVWLTREHARSRRPICGRTALCREKGSGFAAAAVEVAQLHPRRSETRRR